MNQNKYYIQNGFVVNCILWWKKGDHGYTLNLDDAKLFTEERAKEICASIGKSYKMWAKEKIESHAERHVQDFEGIL